MIWCIVILQWHILICIENKYIVFLFLFRTVHQNHSNLDTFITLEVYEENECSIVLALNTGYIFR